MNAALGSNGKAHAQYVCRRSAAFDSCLNQDLRLSPTSSGQVWLQNENVSLADRPPLASVSPPVGNTAGGERQSKQPRLVNCSDAYLIDARHKLAKQSRCRLLATANDRSKAGFDARSCICRTGTECFLLVSPSRCGLQQADADLHFGGVALDPGCSSPRLLRTCYCGLPEPQMWHNRGTPERAARVVGHQTRMLRWRLAMWDRGKRGAVHLVDRNCHVASVKAN